MKKTALITKDNRLIEASYRLSLVEHRIIQMAIAWTRAHATELTPDTWVELRSAEYSALYDLDEKISYRQLKAAARALRDRRLVVDGVHPETGDVVTIEGGWVSYVMYSTKNGAIALQFSKLIIPYIFALEQRFTSYQIQHVANFSSVYAIRLYELCKQYLVIGQRFFELNELREYLEANDPSYDRIDNFKSKVLDRAIQQINTTSDIRLSYMPEKNGRAVSGYLFRIASARADAASMLNAVNVQNPVVQKSATVVMRSMSGLSIAENSMLKELSALTGRSNVELLLEARAAAGQAELFLWLDAQLKSAKIT